MRAFSIQQEGRSDMRNTIAVTILAGALALAFSFSAGWAADVKIGVVHVEKVLENSTTGKSVQAELRTQKDKLEGDLKQKANEIQEMEKRLQREAAVMSKESREEKEREYRIKASDFQALQKKYRGDLQDLERKLMGQLKKDIDSLMTEIGKKDGYTLIVSNIGILYSQPSVDITERVIQELNARSGKKAGQ
jgi:outer membrane protein